MAYQTVDLPPEPGQDLLQVVSGDGCALFYAEHVVRFVFLVRYAIDAQKLVLRGAAAEAQKENVLVLVRGALGARAIQLHEIKDLFL